MRKFLYLFLSIALCAISSAAANVKVMQVEYIRDSTYLPDAALVPVGVKFVKDELAQMYPATSTHANGVVVRLLAHPENIAELEVTEAGVYWGRGGIGLGRTQYYTADDGSQVEIYPKPTHGQLVENHSYGMMDLNDMAACLAKLDRRADRDNVVIVVGVPDSNMGHVASPYGPIEIRIPNCAHNIIAVGSGRGFHEILPGGRVDIVTDEDWTSYGAPKVSEVAAAMISETLNVGKTYRWNEVREYIMLGADDLGDHATYGAGRLNREKTLALWRQHIGTVAAPVVVTPPPADPAPVVVAPPPVVVTPPPIVTPPPVEPAPVVTPPPVPTVDQLCAAAAGDAGVQYDPGWHTFSNVTAANARKLVEALASRGL